MCYTLCMEWFENEDFWINFGPIMFDAQRWAEAPDIAENIKKIAGLSENSTVLDCGCGCGRISIELALLGLNVTGVDIMQPLLDAAKESSEDENVQLELIKKDLREFDVKEKYDCAINLYTSFGYCDTIEDDIKILKNIYNSIKKNGWFIMECISRETAVQNFIEGEWFERAGKYVLTDFSVEGAWEGLRSHWMLIDKKTGKKYDHTFVQRLYSAIELKQILLTIGFSSCEIYGDFDFSPYNEKMRTMVLICKK